MDDIESVEVPERGIDALDAWSMVESSPDGMLLTDEHGTILVANTRVEELFGHQRQNLVGRAVEDLMPKRFRAVHLAHRTRYRAEPAVRAMGEGLILAGLRADGSEFPLEVSLSPVGRDGELRVVVTVRDISTRLATDAHVHAVVDTVDATTDGFFLFPADTLRFEYVNQGAVQQLGYSKAELLTMTPLHIKPEYTRASFRDLIDPVVNGETPSLTFTTIHRRRDGVDVPVEIILEYPKPPRTGERRFLVALVRNITERRRAEEERERATLSTESLAEVRAAVLAERPLGDILTIVSRRAKVLADGCGAFVTIPDAERQRQRIVAADSPESREVLPTSLVVDEATRRALDGETYLVPDLDAATEVDEANRNALRAPGRAVNCGLAVRIAAGSGTDALLAVFSRHLDAFDPGQVSAVETLAAEAATAIKLDRARRQQTMLALVEDRERTARDLHDVVIQRLFAAGMTLQAGRSSLGDHPIGSRLDSVVSELDQAIADLRAAIFHLVEVGLDHLVDQVDAVVARAGHQLGFDPTIESVGDTASIPDVVAEQLIPTLTEALSNIARHAEATEVAVTLAVSHDSIDLTVTDDGVGIGSVSPPGEGLANMSARGAQLGGSCTAERTAGGGTEVKWTVPR